MEQVEWPEGVIGAHGSELFDGHDMVIEAFGDRAELRNSSVTAFAYLWRRFGPPFAGSDPHKDLASYILTTADSDVWLWVNLGASGLKYSVGYLMKKEIEEELYKPHAEWQRKWREAWFESHPEFAELEDTEENREKVSAMYWEDRMSGTQPFEDKIGPFPERLNCKEWRTEGGIVHRVNQAIFDALKELERPVYVRDVPIDLFGRCEDPDEDWAAPPSRYAGLPVSKESMDAKLKEEESEGLA